MQRKIWKNIPAIPQFTAVQQKNFSVLRHLLEYVFVMAPVLAQNCTRLRENAKRFCLGVG
ncbi:hypothetical protein ABI_27810 [Asticcacaulis biprosthecium C19]|uniref:Uncharacterized protein n=1 Tax=Asticcacaulis biprosthecium C19 TaxID=715226 RepID=F4QMC5_9CAUL|nr:hypothetical protein ABI_27810 [Asticcacaulis biprosthecium C19]